MLTHENAAAECTVWMDNGYRFSEKDTHLSYLRLVHSYERSLLMISYAYGIRVGFFQGDVQRIEEDLAVLKPTYLPMVPRLLNSFRDTIRSRINALPADQKAAVEEAIAVKLHNLRTKREVRHAELDEKYLKPFIGMLGGRVNFLYTGSAQISPHILDFLKVTFARPIFEGYGLTETTAGGTLGKYPDTASGFVGGPARAVEIKLIDVPELNYFADNVKDGVALPEGEVCFRGPTVFQGYFKQPKKNEEAFQDGWFKSGDIGRLHPNGVLQIIDRRKDIFKL